MKPRTEIEIDIPLVRTLLEDQCTDLAALPLSDAGEGWDNRLFRLGDDLCVRLPRRRAAVPLMEHEQRWLPAIGTQLPLPVPQLRHAGRSGCGYPWLWSITSWIAGRPALDAPLDHGETAAAALGHFLRALHRPAPNDAPRNPFRGVPLASRTPMLRDHLRDLNGAVDETAALELWERALAAEPWPGPPLWIHGDLHPGNLIVQDGRLSGVVDFGDVTAGDPATDLSVAWMLFPLPTRAGFRDAARSPLNPVDADTWLRARGWALALGLAYMRIGEDDPSMSALGQRTVATALAA